MKEKGSVVIYVLGAVVLIVVTVAVTTFYLGKGQDALFGFFNGTNNIELSASDSAKEQTQAEKDAVYQKLNEAMKPSPTASPSTTIIPLQKQIKPTATAVPTISNNSGQLNLTAGSNEPGKVSMSWTLNGDAANGFKEVWADHANPTYPEDHWNYDSDTNLRSYTFSGLPSGQTLHFRVGVYKSGQGVTTYSNDVTVTVK